MTCQHNFPPRPVYLVLSGGILGLMVAMGIARFSYTPILPLMRRDRDFPAPAGLITAPLFAAWKMVKIYATGAPGECCRYDLQRWSGRG